MIRPLTAALFATSLLCAPALAQSVPPAIAAAVADTARPDTDKERDATRKPGETIAFAGVKPGMVVAELAPGPRLLHPPSGQGGGSHGKGLCRRHHGTGGAPRRPRRPECAGRGLSQHQDRDGGLSRP